MPLKKRIVSPDSFVSIDSNKYSVPVKYVGKHVFFCSILELFIPAIYFKPFSMSVSIMSNACIPPSAVYHTFECSRYIIWLFL